MQKKRNSHMKHILLAVLASIFLVFAPGKIMADSAEIEIAAAYRERIALPPDAILEVSYWMYHAPMRPRSGFLRSVSRWIACRSRSRCTMTQTSLMRG